MGIQSLEPVLKVTDVSEHLNCDKNTVYSLIREGELRSIRLGRLIRIPESALADFIAGRQVEKRDR